jgi:uncharacterized SAM-binding protein YcdF (DUF218 family)
VPLKALLLAIAIPPISLMFLAIAGLVLARRKPRLGHALAWCACLLLLVLAMPASGQTMLALLSRGLPAPASTSPPGAIVVLSAELQRGPGEPPEVRPGLLTLDRLRTAAALERRVQLPMLTSGGSTDPELPALGEIMARSLREDFQVPVAWTENRSLDTWQNAQYSAEILRRHGIGVVYLVTSAWHMRRALIAFARAGITVIPAPTPPERMPELRASSFIPTTNGWRNSYYALHEWIGCALYAMR